MLKFTIYIPANIIYFIKQPNTTVLVQVNFYTLVHVMLKDVVSASVITAMYCKAI